MIGKTVQRITPVNLNNAQEARRRLDNLTKPRGSLGRLEEFAERIVAIMGNTSPNPGKKVIITFAGDHGVAEEGVSAYPSEVTRQMVLNFLSGGAGINVLARHAGAEVVVVDIGVNSDLAEAAAALARQRGMMHAQPGDTSVFPGCRFVSHRVVSGTKNMRYGPAMTRDEAVRCIEAGISLAEEYGRNGYALFGTGEMGIGNTTPSSAIASVITGSTVLGVTGKGTGIDDDALKNKIRVIEDAISCNRPNPSDPVDVLSKVGGAEIGGIAGLLIGAAAEKVPVVIDGFISTAGALLAYRLAPETRDYMFAAHTSVERGHKVMLDMMGLRPILDLHLRLGEGTGAALAMLMIDAGLKIYGEMATFDEAGVSGKSV
jgi:nicotinate-nucleotide--dimethylbenzimidazole phosphoribosyltransferase